MGQDVIDQAAQQAGLADRKCVTQSLQIHGWTCEPTDSLHLKVYGVDRLQILALIAAQPELATLLHPQLPYQQAEVIWQARSEMARTVEDVLARRTRALLLNAKASIAAAPIVAQLLATELGRDKEWQQTQLAEYTELARGYVFDHPASTGL